MQTVIPTATMLEPSPVSVRSRTIPAWVMSCLLHATILTVGVFTLRVIPRGVEEPGRGAGIVMVAASAAGRTEYFSESEEKSNSSQGGAAAKLSAANAANEANSKIPLPGVEQMPAGAGPALPKDFPTSGLPGDDTGLPGAGSLLGGGKTGNGLSSTTGEVTLEVFGVKGTGSRFVYVFDRSSSMNGYGGRPLSAAKRELTASLKSLGKVHQFQIIFYNEEPHLFNARPGQPPALCFADDAAKEKAESFVNGITGDGGTQHMTALLSGLGMVPDVIFFLTDADEPVLTEAELKKIRERNRRGTVINCVEFGAGPSSGEINFLKRLAAQNHGQHSYVDVTKLKAAP